MTEDTAPILSSGFLPLLFMGLTNRTPSFPPNKLILLGSLLYLSLWWEIFLALGGHGSSCAVTVASPTRRRCVPSEGGGGPRRQGLGLSGPFPHVTLHAPLPSAVSILGQRPARLAGGGAGRPPGWGPPGLGVGTWAEDGGLRRILAVRVKSGRGGTREGRCCLVPALSPAPLRRFKGLQAGALLARQSGEVGVGGIHRQPTPGHACPHPTVGTGAGRACAQALQVEVWGGPDSPALSQGGASVGRQFWGGWFHSKCV